jgi:hypothetical protein
MATKLPLRFRILHVISQNAGITTKGIMDLLKGEYGKEGQFRDGVISEHLASMRAVGMIVNQSIEMDASQRLIEKVEITDYGKSRLKLLPQSWSAA